MLTRQLCQACERGQQDKVLQLVQERGCNANFPSSERDGRTPLHFAAEGLHAPIVSTLLKVGASVHACDRLGFSPLARACFALAKETSPASLSVGKQVIELLVAAGADFYCVDKFGNSIAHVLAAKGSPEAFLFVRDLMIHENGGRGCSSTHPWSEQRRNDMQTVSHCSASTKTFLLPGWGLLTPLHLAAESGNDGCVKAILDEMTEGENYVNVIDAIGWTPLHWAAMRNHISTIDLLIDYGASPLLEDYMSRTAIDVALSFMHHGAAHRLYEHSRIDKSVAPSNAKSSSKASPSTSSAASGSSPANTASSSSSAESESASEVKGHRSRHHFLAITLALMIVIVSATEGGLRVLAVLANSEAVWWAKALLLVPLVLTTLIVFAARAQPSRLLPCPQIRSLFLLDVLTTLAGLCTIKAGPLILSHVNILQERRLHQSSSAQSTDDSTTVQASEAMYENAMDSSKESELLRTLQHDVWVCPTRRLLNEHLPVPIDVRDAPTKGHRVAIRADLRAEWRQLYAILRVVGVYDLSVVELPFLAAALWWAQMGLHEDEDNEAKWTDVSGDESEDEASRRESSSEGSLQTATTDLLLHHQKSSTADDFTAARRTTTVTTHGAARSDSSSAPESSSLAPSSAVSESSPVQSSSLVSSSAVEKLPLSSSSSSSSASASSAQADPETAIYTAQSELSSPPFPGQQVGSSVETFSSMGNQQHLKITPDFGRDSRGWTELSNNTLVRAKPLSSNPLLRRLTHQTFHRSSLKSAFQTWYREFSKLSDFLKEVPHLFCGMVETPRQRELQLHAIAQIISDRHKPTIGSAASLLEYLPSAGLVVEEDTILRKQEIFEGLLSLLRREALLLQHKQPIPPFIDLDVLNRHQRWLDAQHLFQTKQKNVTESSGSLADTIQTDASIWVKSTPTDRATVDRTDSGPLKKALAMLVVLPATVDLAVGTSLMTMACIASPSPLHFTIAGLLGFEALLISSFIIIFPLVSV